MGNDIEQGEAKGKFVPPGRVIGIMIRIEVNEPQTAAITDRIVIRYKKHCCDNVLTSVLTFIFIDTVYAKVNLLQSFRTIVYFPWL